MQQLPLQISYSLSNPESKVHQFWQCAHQYMVLAFKGEMGAGKTTFISALCHYLGVQESVSSPTYALINEYHFMQNGSDRTIYHMDWYRLRDTAEAIHAGVEDALNQPNAYCFVEWPEKAIELLPADTLWVDIQHGEQDDERVIHLSASSGS